MNGLLLAGGSSSRMGQPKSLIEYHGKPQYQHAAEQLAVHCKTVFVSCRAEQQHLFLDIPRIPDTPEYGEIGPLNGVLSAFDLEETAWLVLGCDYPLLKNEDLEQLFQERDTSRVATVFCDPQNGIPQPLIGIYEAQTGPMLREWLKRGNQSLRYFLEQHAAKLVIPERPSNLKSVDTPAEMSALSPSSNPNPRTAMLATKATRIGKYKGSDYLEAEDMLAVEEPLEIRLAYGPESARITQNLSVTMRTPGADADLSAGFLFTEGIVRAASDIVSILPMGENIVLASLRPDLDFDLSKLERHFYTSSSCGVCGKSSMDAVRIASNHLFATDKPPLSIVPEVIYELPDTLRRVQDTFDATGGLHASALFDQKGQLLALREDVGRHNALDKLIGHYFMQGMIPLDQHILLLSGRASFELLQKAAMAGIRFVCAVGAPSSLAVETAEAFGITLIGFLRDGRFNVYAGKP